MSEQGSRKQFDFVLIGLRKAQRGFIQDDADARYPERHGPTGKRRNFNPALRDGVAFWQAHYPLFLTWIATQGEVAQEPKA